jgi:hypothetical protein
MLLFVTNVSAQQTDNSMAKDESIVRDFFKSLQVELNDSVRPNYTPDELMVKAALFLLNTPYTAHTLEGNREEELVINLRAMDCLTFVENCLALSRAAQYTYPDYDYFIRQLRDIRYRQGTINGYASRLHYTTDWITDNVNKHVVEDITYALGGKRFQPHVGFMSAHPELYPALKDSPEEAALMLTIEKAINQRTTYCYIPQHEIKDKQLLIKNGDIICFTTGLPGLDISHVGIAYWNKSQLSFIHASTKYKKVIINPESLSDYCGTIKTNTGIMVLRTIKETVSK